MCNIDAWQHDAVMMPIIRRVIDDRSENFFSTMVTAMSPPLDELSAREIAGKSDF
jgi:hypothetical protein